MKPETRNSIRRDFLAMIRKEKELRSRQKTCSSRSDVLTTVDQPVERKIRNKNNLSVNTLQTQTTNVQDEVKEIQRNFQTIICKFALRL